MEKITIIIRKLRELVNNRTFVKNENFTPKWKVGDHQKCHIKFPILRKQSFAIKYVIVHIVVVRNDKSDISEDIV